MLASQVDERYDYVFWFGDMNYRVNGTKPMVEHLLQNKRFEVLLANDQLTIERKRKACFVGYKEPRITFSPTFKFVPNTNSYSLSAEHGRIPAWTDRILVKCRTKRTPPIAEAYTSVPSLSFSDHKPVYAIFRISLPQRIPMGPTHGISDTALFKPKRKRLLPCCR